MSIARPLGLLNHAIRMHPVPVLCPCGCRIAGRGFRWYGLHGWAGCSRAIKNARWFGRWCGRWV